MRIRRVPRDEKPASSGSTGLAKNAFADHVRAKLAAENRVAWVAWRKRDGRMTLPHAFRIVGGKRSAKTLCHNAPGEGCSDFREVPSTSERCASCDEVARRSIPRGNALPGPRPRRPDPRTIYEPQHTFDDWDRG